MAITGVLFDLDGTLWNLVHMDDWTEVTAIEAAALQPHLDRLGMSLNALEFIPEFFLDLAASQGTEDFSEPAWAPSIVRALAKFGVTCDSAEFVHFSDAFACAPINAFGISAFPDAGPALEALAAEGLKLGVVTNNATPEAVLRRHFRDLGIPDVFEAVVSSLDLGWRKPHPLIFETALDALGLRPEETAYIGDTYENDIAPALQLGMTAVQRVPPDSPAQPGARHHTITSLLDLRTLLDDPLAKAHPNRAPQAGV